MKVAAVVPSYNPDKHLVPLVRRLADAGFERVYVINDGSDESCLPLFEQAAALPQCVLLRHEHNKGKGRALKTAFAYYLEDPGPNVGVVTLDGDGQHHIDDILAVAARLEAHPDTLVLGARDFSQEDVPAKSALGNKITRGVFRLACGIPITDTQTGLRGIPNAFMGRLLDVAGERYEFETNMLLETKRMGVPVEEVSISTIYIDNNSASHFRPFRDSMRIYALIIKFAGSSLVSSLVDLGLFALFNLLLQLPAAQQWLGGLAPAVGFTAVALRLLIATVGARVCSALFNFAVNRSLVFASKAAPAGALARYALLVAVQMLCSFGGTWLLSDVLPLPDLLAKIITDTILFFASFQIQRRWVFRSGRAAT